MNIKTEVYPAGTSGWNVVQLADEAFQHHHIETVEQYGGEDNQDLLASYIRVGKQWFLQLNPINEPVADATLTQKLNTVVAASREHEAS